MVQTTTKYIVYTHSGGGVRHHHFGTQNNIIAEADGSAAQGDMLNALGFPTLPFGNSTVPFAFMSVHGGADGNKLYTSPGNQTVPVGASDIDILVVYAPPGGIGVGCGPGIWVDAFDVDTGQFSDSLDFIKVLTPPTPPDTIDAAKTTFGNQDGSVSSQTAETVRANTQVDGVPFLEWKRITGTPTIQSETDIHVAQNETGEIWFAFYQSSKLAVGSIPRAYEALIAGIMVWTGDPYCGNGGHIIPRPGPGPSPFKLALQKEVSAKLTPAQQKTMEGYIAEYPAVAQAGHVALTKATDMLNKINAIVGTIKSR